MSKVMLAVIALCLCGDRMHDRFLDTFDRVLAYPFFDASTPCIRIVTAMLNVLIPQPMFYIQSSASPGSMFDFTANIFDVTLAVKPSTCLEYCSTCLELSSVSSLLGS